MLFWCAYRKTALEVFDKRVSNLDPVDSLVNFGQNSENNEVRDLLGVYDVTTLLSTEAWRWSMCCTQNNHAG